MLIILDGVDEGLPSKVKFICKMERRAEIFYLALLFLCGKSPGLIEYFFNNHKRGSRYHDEIKLDEKSDEQALQ
jgi:hypothetical protein